MTDEAEDGLQTASPVTRRRPKHTVAHPAPGSAHSRLRLTRHNLCVGTLVHRDFFGRCAFPFNKARSGSAKHLKCFASARSVSLQPLGLLPARIASSIGDKLRAGARTYLEALTRSEEAPVFGNGHNEARQIATGSKWRGSCFELFPRAAMPQNEVFKYGDRSSAIAPDGQRFSGEAAECAGIHTAVTLKHNHLFNDLVHLDWIDDLLSVRLNLLDC